MPGNPAVIIGSHLLDREKKRESLFLSRRELTGFGEPNKVPCCLAEFSLRRTEVELHDLPAGAVSHIHDLGVDTDLLAVCGKAAYFYVKICVGQTESKGIEDCVSAKGLEIAVADENVLSIDVFVRVPEMSDRRVVPEVLRNGVREFS